VQTTQLVATTLYLVVYLLIFLSGVAYLFNSRFLPYHAAAAGKQWDEVDRPMQLVLQTMLRVIGGLMASVGFTGAALVVLLFGSGEDTARYLTPVPAIAFGLPALWASVTLRRDSGAKTPIKEALGIIILPIVALVLWTI
jgi:uncharacterized membrane protein YuzA (DUF378 family)